MSDRRIETRFGGIGDPAFSAYLAIRERSYQEQLGFPAPRDTYDEYAEFLYFFAGDEVVGGARLVRRTSDGLPLEHYGFVLSEVVGAALIRSYSLMEIGRLAFRKNCETDCLAILFRTLRDKLSKAGWAVCVISPESQARLYRRGATAIGLHCDSHEVTISKESPSYHLGKHFLCVIRDRENDVPSA